MSRIKSSLFLLVILLATWDLYGQAARTPFSAFGYGDYYGEGLVHNQGMGGVGVSNPQIWFLNNLNPALLVNNRITVFEAGFVGDKKRIYSEDQKENSGDGNLNYLALGFPAMRKKSSGEIAWGTAVGLMPYSSVNYRYQFTQQVGEYDVVYSEAGKGGFNQFYWSNGVRLTDQISLGLKTAWIFSSVSSDYSNILNDPNQSTKYLMNVHELLSVKGWSFTPALSFRTDSVFTKYNFNLGLTYDLKSSIPSELDQIFERKDLNTGTILQSDTLPENLGKGKLEIPQRLTVGVSFGRSERWMVATDFTYVNPGSNTQLGLDNVATKNGWKLAGGFELTPDVRSLSSYLKRITYRTGVSAEHGTYLVNGNAVKDFGINFGFSLPVSRISSLDMAFRFGKRGDKTLNGIEENYFKMYFGVTFNDQWFIKRRFD